MGTNVTVVTDKPIQLRDGIPAREVEIKYDVRGSACCLPFDPVGPVNPIQPSVRLGSLGDKSHPGEEPTNIKGLTPEQGKTIFQTRLICRTRVSSGL